MAGREGQQLGNYRLIQLLGRGNFAEVYLGQHVHLDTQAAIKVLHAPLSSQDIEPFRREARTLAGLVHPHIIRVLDFGVEDGLPFLVMDYAPHGSLRERHPKGERLALATVLSYVNHVALALQYAHDQRLIHRDLKPANLLLGRDHEVLLSDFGLALIEQSTRQQQTPQTAGTIVYMAPEQLQGHPGPASDQYALGLVTYEWLCGKRPFEGSVSEVMTQQLTRTPPPLRERVPSIPAEVEQVVLQALDKDPTRRFARVQDFALALQEASRTEASAEQTIFMLSSISTLEEGHASKLTNLPAPLTRFIGREQEVAAASSLLRRPEVRLLTLTGTGGVGKTRLAFQLATELLADFPDGIFFVSLAPISDSKLVLPTIAQALGIKETGARPLVDLLKAFLRDKHLLLFLDNFEQVLPAAPHLTDLLTSCSHLNILVTSRVTLHVQGEQEFPVPPLAVPNPTQLPEPETLSHYAAVALFLQRAQAVKPSFQITSANARAIAEICIRLDGLPLAIELAAARIKLLSPQALLTRLEHRLQLLTGGAQDAPPRQQALRNALDWSYNLLSAQEQCLFRRLAVFVGGCTLEAIEAICVGGGKSDVWDEVASLIDKSLLQQTEQEDGEPRFLMLETIREYALEALEASGEMEAIRQAHAAYYLRLAEEEERRLTSRGKGRWLARLQQEHENLRAALEWLMEHSEWEAALRLGSALWRFWWDHAHLSEGRTLLERVLAGSEGMATSVRARALQGAGTLATAQGDFEQGEILCGQSLALFRALGDPRGSATSLEILGWAASERNDYATARTLEEEALALFREVGDREGITSALFYLAYAFFYQGEYERTRALLEEGLALSREGGDTGSIAALLWPLALVMFFQGDLARAHALLNESLSLSRQEGYKEHIAYALFVLGQVALQQGDVVTARLQGEESLVLFKEVGDRHGISEALIGLAWVSLVQGSYTAARALLEEGFALAREIGNRWLMALCLVGFAAVAAAEGAWAWAARLASAADGQCEAFGILLPPAVRAIEEFTTTAARAQLGEEAFRAARAEGRTMTLEQVLAARGAVTTPTPIAAEPSSAPPSAKASSYPDGLTGREVEVLRLVAQGLTDAQVAEQLVISPRTVSWHLTSIYSKLQLSSRSAATRYAIEHHLV